MRAEQPITDILHSWSTGETEALDDVVAHLYEELRTISQRLLSKERQNHTLQPTALVNEVYLRLLRLKRIRCEDRTSFLGFAAHLMRRILVEHARERNAKKRGGGLTRVDLDLTQLPDVSERVNLLDLDAALSELEHADPALVRLIELRFFAGMTERETATSLGVSRSSVQREWAVAKRWLARAIQSRLEG